MHLEDDVTILSGIILVRRYHCWLLAMRNVKVFISAHSKCRAHEEIVHESARSSIGTKAEQLGS